MLLSEVALGRWLGAIFVVEVLYPGNAGLLPVVEVDLLLHFLNEASTFTTNTGTEEGGNESGGSLP